MIGIELVLPWNLYAYYICVYVHLTPSHYRNCPMQWRRHLLDYMKRVLFIEAIDWWTGLVDLSQLYLTLRWVCHIIIPKRSMLVGGSQSLKGAYKYSYVQWYTPLPPSCSKYWSILFSFLWPFCVMFFITKYKLTWTLLFILIAILHSTTLYVCIVDTLNPHVIIYPCQKVSFS